MLHLRPDAAQLEQLRVRLAVAAEQRLCSRRRLLWRAAVAGAGGDGGGGERELLRRAHERVEVALAAALEQLACRLAAAGGAQSTFSELTKLNTQV